ncbi:hypothetical protein HS1genome_0188 [Sulfodiicoccus acidiphilus]|uniref:DUF309 domain-containing protein n=1 Tax=Sulfodiicoccus acidiphilus TaxID=1670455 RepID=A0A348B0U7_9CREN|nr:DUF309 domain-containing protein [Sulfodiicoccus acidiphilus]BBD71799.1 hypothetical protein HS1genome_0188 [Sulfodiicoccus acidiphilus]GGT99267.1 hypothetical protein GCM10007116_15810 [Sulfodiicoccus acidiphilus]
MRFLLFFKSERDAEEVKKYLRGSNLDVIDVRRGKLLEVDLRGEQKDLEVVKTMMGEPLEVVNAERLTGSFWEKFNSERFWECHELLEDRWKVSSGEERKYLQALIFLCTSLLKYRKGQIEVSNQLLEKALSLISELPEERLPLLYSKFVLNT